MSDTTTSPTGRSGQADRTGDASRFVGGAQRQQPRRSGMEVLLAALGLLTLLAGVPALLLLLDGPPPIPTGLPSRGDLAQPIGFEALLTVLVAVVWLTWLFFAVCVVVEVVAALRGGLARPVPFGGPIQQLARVLVGALLITGVMAGSAGAATGSAVSSDHGPDHRAQAATVVTTDAAGSVTQDDGGGAATADAGASASATQVTGTGDRADAQQDLVGKKVYTVKAPKDGYHDNLWDIAERHLGDGRRYQEIYQLNKDRLQPDGRQLELARLIQPGWNLVMPENATGVPRLAAPPAEQAPQRGGDGAQADSGSASDTESQAGGASGAGAGGAASTGGASDTGSLVGGLGGAGLLAAGVISALWLYRRRHPGREPGADAAEVEVRLRVAASPDRAAWLDRALRELASACLAENVPLPALYGAVVDEDSVELLLAPARTDTCSLWEPVDEGRRWRRTDTTTQQQASAVAPYPALVSLGVDEDGRDVLVDLEAAGGAVAIEGDAHVAAEVAAAIAVQSATSAWSDDVAVTASRLPDGLEGIGDDRIRIVDDLGTVLPDFETRIGNQRQDVLRGRMARRGRLTSELVVCGGAPEPDVVDRLLALAGPSRQAFSVVVAGSSRGARWQLRVDSSGSLSVPALGITVAANRISAAEVDAVAELFAATRAADPGPGAAGDRDRPHVPAPGHEVDDAAWSTAPRRVGVLGPVQVDGAGALEERRLELAVEMVAFLAMHPGGVHPNVLAAAVWPRGVTGAVRDTAVGRVRDWLGDDPEGHPFLRSSADGRLLLSSDVVLDWDAVRTLLLRSRHCATTREERDLLRRSLHLVRGEPFAGATGQRYAWLPRTHALRSMRLVVVDAAHRLAEILRGDGDPGGAAEAAVAGLRLDPAAQLLWRDLLSARHTTEGPTGVRQVLDEMSGRLDGVRLDPETEALVDELLPAGPPEALPHSG